MSLGSSFAIYKSSMDASGSGPPVGSDDEDSFVVLDRESSGSMMAPLSYDSSNDEVLPAVPAFRTNKVREIQNSLKLEISEMNESKVLPELPLAVPTVESIASSVAKISISPDLSTEEIQKHVEKLITENETLKNTIAQNNLSMKSQYARFVTYRDEVVQVMKSYKAKFNEARDMIDKCKEENAKFVSQLEVYINIKTLHEEEIINLKENIKRQEILPQAGGSPKNDVDGELQTELAEAKQKITGLIADKENSDSQIENLKTETEDLKKRLEVACSTVQTLNKDRQQLKTQIENLEKYEKEALSYKRTIEKLTDRLKNTSTLEDQLQTKQQEINVFQFDVSNLKNELAKVKNENEALKGRLSNVSTQSDEIVQSAQKDSALKLNLKESEIADLRQELETARAAGRSQQEIVADLRTKLAEMRNRCHPSLQDDHRQVLQQLSIAQQTITALGNERERTGQEIDKLRQLLQESTRENDEIFALREQLTLYKNDFDAEKESKAALKREKDQIAEDLQNVQMRNKQLQGEVETLRARNEPKTEGYQCPKCSFKFASYQSLENHVHRCLDMDGFP